MLYFLVNYNNKQTNRLSFRSSCMRWNREVMLEIIEMKFQKIDNSPNIKSCVSTGDDAKAQIISDNYGLAPN